MKHYKINNLIENLQRVKMTEDEKSEVFMRTWSTIEKIEALHVSTTRQNRIIESGSSQKSSASLVFENVWQSYFMEKKFVPALSFALLLILTGGTSLAAEKSLPGDVLYAIKLNLNEQVRGFTAVTPEAKAKFALEVTDRRLKEVALLSSKGLLNAETSSIIQNQLLKQAGQIKNQVASLVSTNNIKAAQEVSLNFESSLRAHELILEKISNNHTKQTLSSLAVADSASLDDSSVDTIATTTPVATIAAVSIASTSLASTIEDKNDSVFIKELITTLKAQIATTTAARSILQAVEAGDNSLNREKLLARLSDIKLKTLQIKRIASTTPVSSSVRLSTSLSYINESDSLIAIASLKIASSSYSGALLDLQKASEYLIDAETLISAEYAADPSLTSVINDALSLPNFSKVGNSILEVASSTDGVTATSTSPKPTNSSTASSTTE